MIQLINGDCIEEMRKLDDNSIDLVLTDPPYNISRKNYFSNMNRQGLDFGEWDKNADLFTYIGIAFNLLKPGGALILFSDWRKLGDISKYAEEKGFLTKDVIRYEKLDPMPRNRERRYINDCEYAVWFVKPKAKWTYNRQKDPYHRPKFKAPVAKGLHPTQKPVKVLEELIRIHSNEGELILDPFIGSGTTAIACANSKRNCIGIELDREYYKIAKERIVNRYR